MINYIEKGNGLHVKISSLGHELKEENDIWVSSEDVAVQNIIDTYTENEAKEYVNFMLEEKANELAKENPLKLMQIISELAQRKNVVQNLSGFPEINQYNINEWSV